MSLIICPKCGKQISDTSEKCVHCGFDLTKMDAPDGEEAKNYHKLTSSEQANLRKEFYTVFPKYGAYSKKQDRFYKSMNVSNTVSILCLFGFFALFLAMRIFYSSLTEITATVLLVFFFIFLAVWIIAGLYSCILILFLSKRYKRNEMIVEKKFQKWLSDNKNISYTVTFTKKMIKYKQFFDSVNVDRQDIE